MSATNWQLMCFCYLVHCCCCFFCVKGGTHDCCIWEWAAEAGVNWDIGYTLQSWFLCRNKSKDDGNSRVDLVDCCILPFSSRSGLKSSAISAATCNKTSSNHPCVARQGLLLPGSVGGGRMDLFLRLEFSQNRITAKCSSKGWNLRALWKHGMQILNH